MDKEMDIEELFPKAKPYKVGVGGSMYLHVMPNGSKYWRFSYRFNEKQKTLALGTYPEISQQEAVHKRDEAKNLVKQGIDPAETRREKKNQKIVEARKPVFQPKPINNGFKLSMLDEETFFIENDGQAVFLNKKQAIAVYSFLSSILEVNL